MTPIRRPAEPAALAAVRAQKLASARAAISAGAKVDFGDYAVVKKDLAAMQHNKCCYCEKREEQAKYRDVEHYRPKSQYYWLTWTWENLLFACQDCNREQKKDKFPLNGAGGRLLPEDSPPGAEFPMVLDPSDPAADPTSHIRFVRERLQGLERWIPQGLTPIGKKTIEVCGLDRSTLLSLYTHHVEEIVRPAQREISAAIELADARNTLHAWNTIVRRLLAEHRPFRALSHDALDLLVSARVRDEHSLVLSRPS